MDANYAVSVPDGCDADAYVNVAQWVDRSVVNGPGERFVLWVQGCPFRCAGCINPAFLEFTPRAEMTAGAIAQKVMSVSHIEGITFSGGEPMAQARGLLPLARILKAAGLTVASYSGYTLEELAEHPDPDVVGLLGELDLLIDGRYVAEKNGHLRWRGSDNQRVHFLSPVYRYLQVELEDAHREVELIVGRESFTWTGIFGPSFSQRVEAILSSALEGPVPEVPDLGPNAFQERT